MGRRFIPAAIVCALVALGVAAAGSGLMLERPRLWSASVALAIVGGITPLIYSVNVRILPVFSRRAWQRPQWMYAGIAAGIAGAWAVFAGRALPNGDLETLGHALALAGGLLFTASVILLFRSPAGATPAPPLPYPGQAQVDRIGIRFTRLAGMFLLVGLTVGLLLRFWTPSRGRWDLVWAHAMLLGWFLSMASGVSYHVLSRWTGRQWRSLRTIRAHYLITLIALPLMLVALAMDYDLLFHSVAPFQALAFLLFIWNVAPMVGGLPMLPRAGFTAAACFLTIGVVLGATFAVDPVIGARLRVAHAVINLFGWAGLLVCGVGYYLFPRFAGYPLRWPRLAAVQLAGQGCGVVLTSGAWWWYQYQDLSAKPLVAVGGVVTGAGLLTFATIIATTFLSARRAVVSAPISMQLPRAPRVPR